MYRLRIKARTGVNSGTIRVGNIGSKYRFHDGAMGDVINLASRLEGLNKIYGTQTIISGTTAEMVAGVFRLRRLDLLRVKGRAQALLIHERIGLAETPIDDVHQELLQRYPAGLLACRQHQPAPGPCGAPACLAMR